MEGVQEKILEIINSNIEKASITAEQADEDLFLLGMDSIRFISIVVTLEAAFEIEYPDEYLLIRESNTLNKMANIISSELEKNNTEGEAE